MTRAAFHAVPAGASAVAAPAHRLGALASEPLLIAWRPDALLAPQAFTPHAAMALAGFALVLGVAGGQVAIRVVAMVHLQAPAGSPLVDDVGELGKGLHRLGRQIEDHRAAQHDE